VRRWCRRGGLEQLLSCGKAGLSAEHQLAEVHEFSGSAVLASLFSAGAQLSQPQNSNGNVNSTQILAASLGQQANTVGTMLISRGLDIQPTLTIRNGYLFNIMVTKDMVLQPWQGMQPLAYGTPGRNN
jgi:type IV secretion system protein TrbI